MHPTLKTLPLLFGISLIAQAAPPKGDVTFIQEHPGLVLVAFNQPDACPRDPWTEDVAQRLRASEGTAASIPRNKETVGELLSDKSFRTKGMSVAFRAGERVDVLCGCPDAEELVSWIDALDAGQTWADVRASEISEGGRFDVGGHLSVSQRHLCAGRLDASFDVLEMLWTTLPERMPSERAIRFNRVAYDMAVLARADESVTARVQQLRDALDQYREDHAQLDEWIVLNRVLLDDDRTIAWYDEAIQTAQGKAMVAHAAPVLFGMLVERERWAEAGKLIDDPLDWLGERKRTSGGLDAALDDHAALAAAGRIGDARRYARGVVKAMPDDPGVTCRLLQRAIEAKATHKSQTPLASKCDNPLTVQTWERSL